MLVLINGRFLCQRVTGVQRYAREIVSALDRQKDAWGDIEFRLVAPSVNFDHSFHLDNIPIVLTKGKPSYFWEQLSLPKKFKKLKADYLLSLCNVAPLKLKNKNIISMHDLAVIYHPEIYSKKFVLVYRYLFKRQAARSAALLTGTAFSKNQICSYYHVDPNRIEVIPSSVDPTFGDKDGPIKKEVRDLVHKKFFFSVGSVSKNKNMDYVYACAQRYPDLLFALSGDKNKVFGSVNDHPDLPNLIHLGYLNDVELKTLYSSCYGFIFPSFYEGFGIPPLEALHCGCKRIVASDIPVLHEVLSFCDVNYIDPSDYTHLIDLRSGLKEVGKVTIPYSWDLSAGRIINRLQSLS